MGNRRDRRRPLAGLAGETRFLGRVAPGETVELLVELERSDEEAVAYAGAARVGRTPILELARYVGPMLPTVEFDAPEALRAGANELELEFVPARGTARIQRYGLRGTVLFGPARALAAPFERARRWEQLCLVLPEGALLAFLPLLFALVLSAGSREDRRKHLLILGASAGSLLAGAIHALPLPLTSRHEDFALAEHAQDLQPQRMRDRLQRAGRGFDVLVLVDQRGNVVPCHDGGAKQNQ